VQYEFVQLSVRLDGEREIGLIEQCQVNDGMWDAIAIVNAGTPAQAAEPLTHDSDPYNHIDFATVDGALAALLEREQ